MKKTKLLFTLALVLCMALMGSCLSDDATTETIEIPTNENPDNTQPEPHDCSCGIVISSEYQYGVGDNGAVTTYYIVSFKSYCNETILKDISNVSPEIGTEYCKK